MQEKALLIGLYKSKRDLRIQDDSLRELNRLAETAGAAVVESRLYELREIHAGTYIAKGRIEAIAETLQKTDIHLVLFDEDLSPSQNRNLEKIWGVKVLDRTGLILDIFAQNAKSGEGKLQVEIAQMNYLLPRLSGHGAEFSQLGGGIGTRGPGETRLEMDRRKAHDRLALLKRMLRRVKTSRELHRKKRVEVPIPIISIVGYTNAGKSTLMNYLTGAGVLVEDKLFATLDPTTRRYRLPSGRDVLISDTVGFIRKLPHQLIEAFHATFEEVESASLIIHLMDGSHPQCEEHKTIVEDVLAELGLDQKPILQVFNKKDQIKANLRPEGSLLISALTGEGVDGLIRTVEENLSSSFHHLSLCLPHSKGADLSLLYQTSRILEREDRADGIYLEVELDEKNYKQFSQYRATHS